MYVQDEYEVVRYPKLHHVKIDQVDIIYRNLHVHREFELCLVHSGSATISVNNRSFSVHSGSTFFFNSNEPHEISASEYSSVKIIYIQIANNFCLDYLNLFRNLEVLENDLSSYLTSEQNSEIAQLIRQVVADYNAADDLNLRHCMSNIYLLFCRLLAYVPYHQLDEAESRARKKKAARLRRITEYIDSHYSSRITLSDLAQSEGITLTYLSHFIHDNLKMTFQDYVNNVRFEKALKLIANSNMRLVDVCMESGFSDIKYLNRMFEKRFGCAPKTYRDSLTNSEKTS